MMAIDDVGRLRLYRRLEEVLGLDEAEILMAQLPVRGWHDVATKDDIAAVRMELRMELQSVDLRLSSLKEQMTLGFSGVGDRIRAEIGVLEHQARVQLVAYLGFVVAFAAVLVAALKVH
jgi:hypothetical protein